MTVQPGFEPGLSNYYITRRSFSYGVKSNAVIFGDSHAEQHFQTTGGNVSRFRYGCVHWANALLGSPFDIVGIIGKGGDNSTQVIARINELLAIPDLGYVFIFMGTNDGSSETAIANMETLIKTLESKNIVPIIISLFPNTWVDQATLAYKSKIRTGYYNLSRKYSTVILIESFNHLLDATSETTIQRGMPSVALMNGTTHLQNAGNILVGEIIADELAKRDYRQFPQVIGDWDKTAVEGDPTVVFENPLFAGLDTTYIPLAGVTGDYAKDWKVLTKSRNTITCVGSKVARTDGIVAGEIQRLVVTNVSDTTEHIEFQTRDSASAYDPHDYGYVDGDVLVVELHVDITVDSGTLDILSLVTSLYTGDWSASETYEISGIDNSFVSLGITGTHSLVLRSPSFTLAAWMEKIAAFFRLAPSVGGQVTVDISSLSVRPANGVATIAVG